MVSTSESSTSFPAYMTASSSQVWAITEMSWVISIIERSSFSRRSLMSSITWCATMTSRAVVGSSAMITSGLQARPIATMTLCLMPPLSSHG